MLVYSLIIVKKLDSECLKYLLFRNAMLTQKHSWQYLVELAVS